MSKWTKEVPTEAGWYWIHPRHSKAHGHCSYWSEFDLEPGPYSLTRKVAAWMPAEPPEPPKPTVEFTDEDVAGALLVGPEAWGWGLDFNRGGVWVEPDGEVAPLEKAHSGWVETAREVLARGLYTPKRLRGGHEQD